MAVPRDKAGIGLLPPPHASVLLVVNNAMNDREYVDDSDFGFKPDFYLIPTDVASLSTPHESFVYAVIYWFHSMRYGKCTASNERIAESLPYDSSGNSVTNALTRLEENGLIRRIMNGNERKQIIPLVSYSKPTLTTPSRVPPSHGTVYPITPGGEQIEISNRDKIVLRSQNVFDEDETIVAVDDNGDPIKPRTKATKDPLIEFFRSECKKQVGSNPVIPLAASRTLLITARRHLTDPQIMAMFKDWFALGKPDNETMQITRALSTARINTFKAENGIK